MNAPRAAYGYEISFIEFGDIGHGAFLNEDVLPAPRGEYGYAAGAAAHDATLVFEGEELDAG